jgi:hypothetical protein
MNEYTHLELMRQCSPVSNSGYALEYTHDKIPRYGEVSLLQPYSNSEPPFRSP